MTTRLRQRREFLGALAAFGLVGCGGSGGHNQFVVANSSADDARLQAAVDQIDGMANALMQKSGLPGMAVAVVRGDRTIYAKGFGTRVAGTQAPVDADTVFQLASMSKSIGASAVAQQVGLGGIAWDTPVRRNLPWFELKDPAVSAQLTIGDLYSHRSGLPEFAGDRLEDMGYDQLQVLQRLRYLPLDPFRNTYHYTNFGLTAGATAVATAAGMDWASLCERAIYTPLGMSRTSSRFADFQTRSNRVVGHVKANGVYVPGPVRMPDAQAPAASVTSSVNDVARWLSMMLGQGVYAGKTIVDASALAAAVSPQIQTSPASADRPAGHYGFGFNVGTTAAGHASFSHSGAFALGTGTAFTVVPATGVGMVALTNATPIGIPETLVAQFFDLVQFGSIQRPWADILTNAFAPFAEPEGSLVGIARPTQPAPAKALSAYAGTYGNAYHGPAQVVQEGGGLVLVLGPTPLRLPLTHWDGDVFTFTLFNENATPGTISKASFAGDRVTLEYYDRQGLGTFVRG
ncbi:serine hydrolase [Variovorax robiniae]|uniref:Serine hydrolase n=1 Tax=Variovorax robiniae TaxID=1836199 RepID=A0ABU8X2F2_9BURK